MNNDLINAIHNAVNVLNLYPSNKVNLFHHNDSDGLSSGAILIEAFNNYGYDVARHSLEKPYPQILDKIFTTSGQIIIFADFAGKIAPLISKLNKRKNLVIILDHHPAEAIDDPTVFNLDGDLFGLKGDRDISASATCYLFAEALMNLTGKDARQLSHLGILGAIGDGFLVDGSLSGVNNNILKIAETEGLARVEKSKPDDEYFIIIAGVEYAAGKICESLDTLGGVGYYDDGTTLGIEICSKGMNPVISRKIEILEKKKVKIFTEELEILKSKIKSTDHLQWFNVENRFQPMGVKMIGVFCNQIKDMDFLDDEKYLAGFQTVPDQVPGFGDIPFNSTKISMRVSRELTDKIRSGEIPGLNTFLPAATTKVGGFVDACHGLSAATTVKIGQEQLLIDEIEKELEFRMS